MIELRAVALAVLVAGCAHDPGRVVPVHVANHSTPTACAEEDNVDLRLTSPDVRRFQIEARHPVYLGALAVDSTAPDFTDCQMGAAAAGKRYAPGRRVLGASAAWQIVGITYPTFWRAPVPVWVGGHRFDDLHLIQIWTKGRAPQNEEVLVLYPPDGYWRARPLAPPSVPAETPDAPATAYGSSFLIGPVDGNERPYVAIERVTIDPETAIVVLDLASGGRATARIASLDRRRIVVDAALSDGANNWLNERANEGKNERSFAALRSMFVSETNADAAEVTWRSVDGVEWRAPILAFTGARVLALTAGRSTPGRHNTSAPDVTFSGFSASGSSTEER